MGFRISWMATRASKDAVLKALGAVRTERTSDWFDFPFALADLSNGWHLIWSEDESFFADEMRCEQLSNSFPLLACYLSETVMESDIAEYRDGDKIWSITHDAEESLDHIAIQGVPPDAHRAILEEARRVQSSETENVDHIFDVPADLGYQLCGFKHDEFEDGSLVFQELTIPKKGILSRLFGG